MKHKTKILALLIAALAVWFAVWVVPAIIHKRIEGELSRLFRGGKVSVGKLAIENPLAFSIRDILVDGDGYQLTVQKASVDSGLNLTLLKPRLQINKIIPLDLKSLGGSVGSQPRVRLNTIHLRELTIAFRPPAFSGEIRGSVDIDVALNRVRSAHLETDSWENKTFKLKKVAVNLPVTGAGTVTAEQLKVGKLKVTDIRGDVLWEDAAIRVFPIRASWIRGSVTGQAQFLTEDPFEYEAEFQIQDSDLSAFSEEMDLGQKMTAEGRVTGRIGLNGNLNGISFLRGSFASEAGGGNLVVRDPNWLKYLAQNTRQSLELVEAAFKEYHFDMAAATMASSGKDLKFAIRMNGDKGRRDFEVNLHDQL